MMTYSFPCQDLTLAGERRGMAEGSDTRSSLLWQVGRILEEMKAIGQLPDVLLMENVYAIENKDNEANFAKWRERLCGMGYANYWKTLSATGFGIPQTRMRTFMVSVLGEQAYDFPKERPLTRKLNDFLDREDDPRLKISDAAVLHYLRLRAVGKHDNIRTRRDKVAKTLMCSTSYGRGVQVLDTGRGWMRKLSTREMFRLQGLTDGQIDRIDKAKYLNDNDKRHLAGDSICVPVLEAIFRNMGLGK